VLFFCPRGPVERREDPIAVLRSDAHADVFDPHVRFGVHDYAQAGDALDLPRAYGTIYICDSFGIAGDAEALARCYPQLAAG
jgi:hypothetical protein